jgi:hypothetical protein
LKQLKRRKEWPGVEEALRSYMDRQQALEAAGLAE